MPNKKQNIELHIRNMVCPRCITVVSDTLRELGYEIEEVELGRLVIKGERDFDRSLIDEKLREHGFGLIENKNQQLVEKTKTLLIQYVQALEEQEEAPKLSDYLSEKLHQNYSSVSSAFSESEETTIEKYLIHLKIERVKELLSYEELTLSEIAWKLNYSSVQYLSNQFKKITGETVSSFRKNMDEQSRQSLDAIR